MASTTATSASTTASTTPSTPTWCRKCNVGKRMVKGEMYLTPVAAHVSGCPNGTGEDEEPKFSFPPLCLECHNQEEWRKAYQAWEADNSLDLPCPGAPRVHTCELGRRE